MPIPPFSSVPAFQKSPLQICTRTDMHNENYSNGSSTGANSRCAHVMSPTYSGGDFQIVYGNFTPQGTATSPASSGTLTMTASIEYPSGTVYPVFFNGQRAATIASGANVVSDNVGITIPAGATFWTRSFVTVTVGQTWPLGFITNNNDTGVTQVGGYSSGVSQTDGTLGSVPSASFGYAFSPIAVIGKSISQTRQTSVGLIGDSLMHAPNPNTAAISFQYHRSAYTEALYNQIPFIQASMAGSTITNLMNGSTVINPYLLETVAKYCTHVICDLGVNDYRTGASYTTMQTNLTNLWQFFTSRGIKVWQSTISPNSTSTDGWATTTNQTANSNDAARVSLNTWIRTNPSPLSGYIEIADLCETSRNSGIWKAAVTTDGLHPIWSLSAGQTVLTNWQSAVSAIIPSLK
jgi:hypothetical protein